MITAILHIFVMEEWTAVALSYFDNRHGLHKLAVGNVHGQILSSMRLCLHQGVTSVKMRVLFATLLNNSTMTLTSRPSGTKNRNHCLSFDTISIRSPPSVTSKRDWSRTSIPGFSSVELTNVMVNGCSVNLKSLHEE